MDISEDKVEFIKIKENCPVIFVLTLFWWIYFLYFWDRN